MSENEGNYIFIRHAESEKNLRDITGGEGEMLSEHGIKQAEMLLKKLAIYLERMDECNIISSDVIQARQTAKKIADFFSKDYSISSEIAPAGLGIASGMSSKEIKEKYPEIFDLLNRWRKQEIEACELKIPGIESPEVFWSRIINFIKILPKDRINIVVCTRSVMVMVANLIKGNTPQLGGKYKHVNIGNCDIIAFKLNKDDSFLLLDEFSSVEEEEKK